MGEGGEGSLLDVHIWKIILDYNHSPVGIFFGKVLGHIVHIVHTLLHSI